MEHKERKAQVIAMALELLAKGRVDQVTTRKIAKGIGVSQPALFRHFHNKEEILIAVVNECKDQLARVAGEVLGRRDGPLEQVAGLTDRLLNYVEETPGLPRILFHDVAGGEDEALRATLKHLVSMQRSLIEELAAAAVRAGDLPEAIDPASAGKMWLALVQGLVFQWQLDGQPSGLGNLGEALFATWLGGVTEGCRRTETVALKHSPKRPLRCLDVRPILADGDDPLAQILGELDGITGDGLLVVQAPFEPRPLVALLGRRGHSLSLRQLSPEAWELWVLGREAAPVADLSCLPMPEPLEQALILAEGLEQGQSLIIHTPKLPRILEAQLLQRGFEVAMLTCGDGAGLAHIVRGGT